MYILLEVAEGKKNSQGKRFDYTANQFYLNKTIYQKSW